MMTEQSFSDPLNGADSGSVEIICQQCQKTDVVPQYHNIDLTVHPQWKEELLDGAFFNWSCPYCGNRYDFSYASRYLDESSKLGIVLKPNVNTSNENDVAAVMNQRLEGLSMPGYRHRICGNFFAMQELVRIQDAGLDDRIVQLLKPFIIGQLQSMGKQVWNGFFQSIEEVSPETSPLNGVIYMSENKESGAVFGDSIYWFDIHLTNREVLHQGINHTAYCLCARLLEKQGYGEDNGQFQLYDLNWAIGFHNERD